MVEHLLAKEKVVGSNPIFRSKPPSKMRMMRAHAPPGWQKPTTYAFTRAMEG